MQEMTREEVARELGALALAVEADHVQGVVIIAVHANGTSSEILVPPNNKAGVEKMMLAMDRTHFRAQVACYLAPKETPNAHH